MLSSKYRFHGRSSLKPVYGQGRVIRSDALSVRYRLNPNRRNYRCAVVVSKKTEKSAVKRNRMRRKIYEQIRQFDGKITQPYDIVVTVYSPVIWELPAGELQKRVNRILAKAGLI